MQMPSSTYLHRNNLHAGNSSETNCNSSYYLRRTRYNFKQANNKRRRKERERERQPALYGEYFTVINDHGSATVFLLPRFSSWCVLYKTRGHKIGSKIRYERKALSQGLPDEKTSPPSRGLLRSKGETDAEAYRISCRYC